MNRPFLKPNYIEKMMKFSKESDERVLQGFIEYFAKKIKEEVGAIIV